MSGIEKNGPYPSRNSSERPNARIAPHPSIPTPRQLTNVMLLQQLSSTIAKRRRRAELNDEVHSKGKAQGTSSDPDSCDVSLIAESRLVPCGDSPLDPEAFPLIPNPGQKGNNNKTRNNPALKRIPRGRPGNQHVNDTQLQALAESISHCSSEDYKLPILRAFNHTRRGAWLSPPASPRAGRGELSPVPTMEPKVNTTLVSPRVPGLATCSKPPLQTHAIGDNLCLSSSKSKDQIVRGQLRLAFLRKAHP
jgi:hypothetical protein